MKVFLIALIIVLISVFSITIFRQAKQTSSEKAKVELCSNVLEKSKKQQCWDEIMSKTLEKEGLDKAFILMDELFHSDPEFASNCHGFAHKLGEKAYMLYANHKSFDLPNKTYYCGYGFYHGFMEKLLHNKGTLDEARDFCKLAGEKLKAQNADAEGACYHGIGHGAVEDVTDPKFFGNPQGIIQPSLNLCERVSDSSDHLFRCITGVFNALEIVTSEGRYNLSLNQKDPLWICRTQPDKYKRACYTQMVVAVMHVTFDDFVQSAQILNTIPEDAWATESLSGLMMESVRLGRTDFRKTAEFCRNITDRFHFPCISGFAEGFLKYGPPQTEYVKALDFCLFEFLTDEEHKACYGRILPILSNWYTHEKASQICFTISEKYRSSDCKYN